MPPSLAIGFFKTATYGNTDLLHTWAFCETITDCLNPNTSQTYDEYFKFLMSHAK